MDSGRNIMVFSYTYYIFVCIHRGGGLQALWMMIPISYFVLNVSLIIIYAFFTDWNKVAEGIQKGGSIDGAKMTAEVSTGF